jgi:hypothetical protein
MGFLSWIKGRASPGASTRVETHSTSVELGAERDSVVRGGVEVSDPAARRTVIDEVDELAHRFLTLGADAAGPARPAG